MHKLLLLILLFTSAYAVPEKGNFSGRVSKVNPKAGLIRIKVTFSNVKYINKRDKLQFWNDYNPTIKCDGYVLGKSPDYLLVKVPNFAYCDVRISMAAGRYLRFFSQDLVNNINMGQELLTVLLKKQVAIGGKVAKEKKSIDSHLDKVESVNTRFAILREKLEKEWRDEIAALEEDYTISLKNYKSLKTRQNEIEHKIELYRIEDDNFEEDRWALDSNLFYKK